MGFFAKFVALQNEKYMEKEIVDLLEFQSRLKEGIECLFPTRLWIRAEVSAVKARNGGHCYLELSQSDDKGLVAKATAIIWSSRYRFLAPYFESVTGSPLSEGMKVLVEAQANYSPLYGFSLIINDMDPEYSLGLKELERRRTIERLGKEGLLELQKEHSLPLLPYRFAVISAEDAAGYRDFMMHLQENPYGFKVCTELYPALMQGADCPESVICALDRILESGRDYDAVLILRGGGARLDLACFDDYGLSAVIAQYPLPVLTAIGHDQDFHVCDMVAYEYLKTPTALADYIMEIYEDEDARLTALYSRMKLAFSSRISGMESVVDRFRQRIRSGFMMRISFMESALQVLQTRIVAADPKRIIERGYALAVDHRGVVVKGAAGRNPGEKISMVFSDGILECTVDSVIQK